VCSLFGRLERLAHAFEMKPGILQFEIDALIGVYRFAPRAPAAPPP
jgi:hypothetical protein